MNAPKTVAEAVALIAEARARGGGVLCAKCRQPANLLISCEDGTLQGAACSACWASHLDYIEISSIAIVSGMAEAATCSACGADPVGSNHIITTEV